MSEVVVKGVARYPRVMTAAEFKNDGKFKFSVELLVLKGSEDFYKVDKTFNELFKNTYPSGPPKSMKKCWKDLAIEEPENTDLSNYMALKLSSGKAYPPSVIDAARQKVIDPSADGQILGQDIYVQGKLFSYANQSQGIACYLNAVMFTGVDGVIPKESFSKAPSAESIFSGIGEGPVTPSAPAMAPPVAPSAR